MLNAFYMRVCRAFYMRVSYRETLGRAVDVKHLSGLEIVVL